MTVRAMQTAEIAKLFILAVSCLAVVCGNRLSIALHSILRRGSRLSNCFSGIVRGCWQPVATGRGSRFAVAVRSLCGRCAVRGRCAVHLSRFAIRDAYAYARRSRSRFAVATGCGCCNRTPKPYSLPIITIVLITHIATNATIATAVRIVLVIPIVPVVGRGAGCNGFVPLDTGLTPKRYNRHRVNYR